MKPRRMETTALQNYKVTTDDAGIVQLVCLRHKALVVILPGDFDLRMGDDTYTINQQNLDLSVLVAAANEHEASH